MNIFRVSIVGSCALRSTVSGNAIRGVPDNASNGLLCAEKGLRNRRFFLLSFGRDLEKRKRRKSEMMGAVPERAMSVWRAKATPCGARHGGGFGRRGKEAAGTIQRRHRLCKLLSAACRAGAKAR